MAKRAWVLCLVIALGVLAQQVLARPEPKKHREVFSAFPKQIGRWSGTDLELSQEVLDVLRLTDYLNRGYITPEGNGLWLYIGYYDNQRSGIVYHSPRGCLPGGGWQFVEFKPFDVTLPTAGVTLRVNKVVIAKGLDRQVLLYWYEDRGRVIASEFEGKLYAIRDAITMNRTDGAIVRISAPFYGEDASQTLSQEIEFLDQVFPILGRFIPGKSLEQKSTS